MSAVDAAHELKGLETRLAKARAASVALKAELADVNNRYQANEAQIRSLEKRILELTTKAVDPIVTEHAMLRYLERVHLLDLGNIRNAILDDEAKKLIQFMGSGKIQRDGFQLVVKNKSVVTIE